MEPMIKRFPIGAARFRKALLEGFRPDGNALRTIPGAGVHSVLLGRLDSAERGCAWGRLAFSAELGRDMVLNVRAFASDDRELPDGSAPIDLFLLDPEVAPVEKRRFFQEHGGIFRQGCPDLLLYGLSGRYLWIWIEILGQGDACLEGCRAYAPGDNFMNTFPEIYREQGGFFHRYLSIFSSMYADLQHRIDSLGDLMDLDTAPAPLLPVFARWLGLELDGNFLEEERLRRLLKAAPHLLRKKGTRQALEGLLEILLDQRAHLVEQRLLQDRPGSPGDAYGDSPFDFTVLINAPADEVLHARLNFLIGQFKPVRSRVRIVFLGNRGALDGYSHLDINARLLQPSQGRLDDSASMNGMTYLTAGA